MARTLSCCCSMLWPSCSSCSSSDLSALWRSASASECSSFAFCARRGGTVSSSARRGPVRLRACAGLGWHDKAHFTARVRGATKQKHLRRMRRAVATEARQTHGARRGLWLRQRNSASESGESGGPPALRCVKRTRLLLQRDHHRVGLRLLAPEQRHGRNSTGSAGLKHSTPAPPAGGHEGQVPAACPFVTAAHAHENCDAQRGLALLPLRTQRDALMRAACSLYSIQSSLKG